MANEITALERDGEGLTLLFLFPVATPVLVAGQNVVPTPSVDLPPLAAAVLTVAEKAARDAGTTLFEVLSFRAGGGLGGPALLARVRQLYQSRAATVAAEYSRRYQFAGNRFNAV